MRYAFYLGPDPDDNGGGASNNPPAGDPPQGDPPAGDQPGGDPPQGDPPAGIDDDTFFAEAAKRFADKGLKSKEDFQSVIEKGTKDYSNHIVAKNDLVKKLNDFNGEPETFLRLSKLDVDAMDNRAAIIEDIKIKEGVDNELAEALFQKRYGYAMKSSEDVDFDATEHKLAMHNLNKDAKLAKDSLAQYKVAELEKGQQKPDPDAAAKAEAKHNELWEEPIKNELKGLQKIDIQLKYKLPDNTEVDEVFSYGLEDPKAKQSAQEILLSKTTGELVDKLVRKYGVSADGKSADFKNLVSKLTALDNLDDLLQKVASAASSKAIEHHIKNVRPGNLNNDGNSGNGGNNKAGLIQNIADAMNAKATKTG